MPDAILMAGRRRDDAQKDAVALCNTSVSDADISLRGMLSTPDRLLAICNAMTDYLNEKSLEQVSRRNLIARYQRQANNSLKTTYNCGVLNCGNGKCVHELTERECPHCGHRLVKVKTNGHAFCSNHESICDYEE